MWIEQIWRYPVKSMAGERLERVTLRGDGLDGDRIVHVEDPRGRVVTSRSRPKLLGLHATLGPDGEPHVEGRPWTDEAVAAEVRRAVGSDARLVRFDGEERFDILPLLVATDGAVAEFGHDVRRLRPNLVIGGVPGLAERTWEGKVLRVGGSDGPVISIADLRGRCIMTTFDPDTLEQDVNVLRSIRDRFDGTLALNCAVLRGGELRVGDAVELVDDVSR